MGVAGRFAETDLDAELGMVELNCASTVQLAKHVVRDMVARGEGRILFTSSVASQAPEPFQAVYSATKAFVQFLALGIREELTDTRMGATDAKDDPAQVARQGYEGLMAGEASVFAGSLASKAMGRLSAITPGNVATAMKRPMTEPGSAES